MGWRVSDVRNHLALQYVPKVVWPAWISFLSQNKNILKQIMVTSYFHNKSPEEISRIPRKVSSTKFEQQEQQQQQKQRQQEQQDGTNNTSATSVATSVVSVAAS